MKEEIHVIVWRATNSEMHKEAFTTEEDALGRYTELQLEGVSGISYTSNALRSGSTDEGEAFTYMIVA